MGSCFPIALLCTNLLLCNACMGMIYLQIASLMCSSQIQIFLKFQPVQRQRGSNDCGGLFAQGHLIITWTGNHNKFMSLSSLLMNFNELVHVHDDVTVIVHQKTGT